MARTLGAHQSAERAALGLRTWCHEGVFRARFAYRCLRSLTASAPLQVPPRARAEGYKAADWDLTQSIWSGRVIVKVESLPRSRKPVTLTRRSRA